MLRPTRAAQEPWYGRAVSAGRLHVICLVAAVALAPASAWADDEKTPPPKAEPAAKEPAARPPAFDDLDASPDTARTFDATPTGRHLDIGASFIFVSPIANSLEVTPPTLRYDPGSGVGVSGRIVILPYLQAAFVFSWAAHGLDIDRNALGLSGVSGGPLTSYRLEVHALPTLPLGERVRLFGIVGLGWGRLEVGALHSADESGTFLIRGRGASYFDVPLGLGASIAILPGWLSLDAMFWGAPTFAKKGTAHTPIQAFDGEGKPRTVGPMPQVPVWFTQSLGFSLLL